MDLVTRVNSTTIFVQSTGHRGHKPWVRQRFWRFVAAHAAGKICERSLNVTRPNVLSEMTFPKSGAVEYSFLMAYDDVQTGM